MHASHHHLRNNDNYIALVLRVDLIKVCPYCIIFCLPLVIVFHMRYNK